MVRSASSNPTDRTSRLHSHRVRLSRHIVGRFFNGWRWQQVVVGDGIWRHRRGRRDRFGHLHGVLAFLGPLEERGTSTNVRPGVARLS